MSRSRFQRRVPRHAGFALIELLVTVAIIGVITLIALPNLREALDRSRQTATRADMQKIAEALDRYAFDHSLYPEGRTLEDVEADLVPLYLKELNLEDRWGWPYELSIADDGLGFTLRSPGKDGAWDEEADGPEATDEGSGSRQEPGYHRDLVMVDGVFADEAEDDSDDDGAGPRSA